VRDDRLLRGTTARTAVLQSLVHLCLPTLVVFRKRDVQMVQVAAAASFNVAKVLSGHRFQLVGLEGSVAERIVLRRLLSAALALRKAVKLMHLTVQLHVLVSERGHLATRELTRFPVRYQKVVHF